MCESSEDDIVEIYRGRRRMIVEKISVIIPTYNRGHVIESSIRSVLNQTYENIEVIVVDDGSSDNTEDVVTSIGDDRVRYIKCEKNKGASMARNIGVSHASAKLIAFHDSDDFWRAEKLEKQMEYWSENPQYAMIYSSYLMHRNNDNLTKVPDEDWWGELEGDIFLPLLVRNTIGAPTMLMQKECFEELGGFDTTLKCIEDWEFAVRFAQNWEIGYVKDALVDAYMSEGGVSSHVGDFFYCRCKMITEYRRELESAGLFDVVVSKLLQSAEAGNVLAEVKNILLFMLQEKNG